MKNLFVIIIFLLFPFAVSIAEDSTVNSSRQNMDVQSKSLEENAAQGVGSDRTDIKEQEKSREEFWKTMKKLGHEGDPNSHCPA